MAKNHIKTDTNSNVVEVKLEVFFIPEGDYIVSYCPALELSSFGKNEKESKIHFADALDTFIIETEKRGTLEKVLLDLGWELKKIPVARYTPPKLNKKLATFQIGNKSGFQEKVKLPI